MKKILAIFLLCLYVFGATDAYQALKLPQFFSHYFDHKKKDPSITLTEFIRLHYQGKIVIDNDFDKDMQLPFKTMETDFCFSVSPIVPHPVEIEPVTNIPIVRNYIIHNDNVFSLLSDRTIFQPPRVA